MNGITHRVCGGALVLVLIACAGCRSSGASYEEGEAAYQRGDYEEALSAWRPLADDGHALAQARLGVMYFHGEGVEADPHEAVGYWTEAASGGSLEAMIGLGNAYAGGLGVEEDREKAVRWWRLAAEEGHIDAQIGLGNAYLNGDGVEQDFVQAERWWKKAAAQGSNEAKFGLGNLYLSADDADHLDELEPVRGHSDEGLELVREAAEGGHAAAQYGLGVLYQVGRGVERDEEKARGFLQSAAEQGHGEAAARLRTLAPGAALED